MGRWALQALRPEEVPLETQPPRAQELQEYFPLQRLQQALLSQLSWVLALAL